MKIFISKNGRRKGPYSPQQLKEMLARNEISMSDLAWYEGCAEWSRIQEMPELIQAFSQAAPPPKPKPKPKPRAPISSTPFFQNKVLPFWNKFRTQKTLHLVIICVTLLLVLWIWKSADRSANVAPAAENKPAEVNVGAIQAVIKQDHDLASVMQIKRKVTPANTDEALSAIAVVTRNYATNGLRINLASCPRDFAEAYTRLFVSWQELGEAISKHPHIPDGSGPIVEGFFRNLDQDIFDPMTEPPESMADWFDQVATAHHKVQKEQQEVNSLTTKYGVRTSS